MSERRERSTPPDLVFCGDNQTAKKTAASLIRDVGFNPIDLGDLSAVRYVEPFAVLVAQIAYGTSTSPQLTYRFEHLRTPTKRKHSQRISRRA